MVRVWNRAGASGKREEGAGLRKIVEVTGTSLVVQWLRLHASNPEDVGSIPDLGSKTPHAAQCSPKIENKNTL